MGHPGFRKRLRGILKRCFPYGWQRVYAHRIYGICFPELGIFWDCLPFGLVCALKGMDPDVGCGAEVVVRETFLSRLLEPKYRLSLGRRRRLLRDRAEGRVEFAEAIARNRSVRILVVLHLYYEKAWPVLRTYLENLAPYSCDFVVTYCAGRCSEAVLKAVREFRRDVRLVECANRGFDIWPFVKVLNETDLSAYDIVFKIHSKGIGRPSIFIYGQVFKYADWFFNLLDGVLGGKTVHRAVGALASRQTRLVAAENLIVRDPAHKRRFVRNFCRDRHLDFREDYRFVAGTCFAARAETLLPLRGLGLTEADFAPTARGTFSTAHAVERWMCFPAEDAILGLPVPHRDYAREREACRASCALRLLEDGRFDLDDEFVYRVLETRNVQLSGYDVCRVRLGDIRRMRHDGSICSLEECEPYRYLRGEVGEYDEYCRVNRDRSGFAMSRTRFDALRASLVDYDPRRMPVVRGDRNVLLDGQHRCCVLLDRFGPDHEIEVVKIW